MSFNIASTAWDGRANRNLLYQNPALVVPADLVDAVVPAFGLIVVTSLTKLATGWYAAGRVGARNRKYAFHGNGMVSSRLGERIL